LVDKLNHKFLILSKNPAKAAADDLAELSQALLPMAFDLEEASVFSAINELASICKLVSARAKQFDLYWSYDSDQDEFGALNNTVKSIDHQAVASLANFTFNYLEKTAEPRWRDKLKLDYALKQKKADQNLGLISRYLGRGHVSKYHGLGVISTWPGWYPAEKNLLANLTMAAITENHNQAPDDLIIYKNEPEKILDRQTLIKSAFRLAFNEINSKGSWPLYSPGLDPFLLTALRVFSDFSDLWPGLFSPFEDFSPIFNSLSHNDLLKLWLFTDENTNFIDDYLAKTGQKLFYTNIDKIDRLNLNLYDYYLKHHDQPGHFIAKLGRLKLISHPGSFGFLLDFILSQALNLCAQPISKSIDEIDFFLYCAEHKDFFIQNMPKTPVLVLLKLVQPDKTLNQEYLPNFLQIVSELKDQPRPVAFAFGALFLLSCCKKPEANLMAKLFTAAMPQFVQNKSLSNKYMRCLRRHQNPNDFAILSRLFIKHVANNMNDL
jgi:hypothetical protein